MAYEAKITTIIGYDNNVWLKAEEKQSSTNPRSRDKGLNSKSKRWRRQAMTKLGKRYIALINMYVFVGFHVNSRKSTIIIDWDR